MLSTVFVSPFFSLIVLYLLFTVKSGKFAVEKMDIHLR